MKGETEFWADYFKLSAYIESGGRELWMHEYELEADNLLSWQDDDVMDIVELEIGRTAGVFLTEFWMPMTINNIEQLYMIVQWKGKNDDNLKEEKIILIPNEI